MSASKDRVAAPCPHFQTCGGCHYQHITAAEQVRLKKDILRETLSRLGGISWDGEIQDAYRGALWIPESRTMGGEERDATCAGIFFAGELIHCADRPVSGAFPEAGANFWATAGNGADLVLYPTGILEIEAFADSADEKIALNVAFERFPKPAAELATLLREAMPQIDSLLLLDQKKDKFELTGPGYLIHEAGGFKFRVSHLSFFQVNRFLIGDLLKTVTAGRKASWRWICIRAWDFSTLPLARAFERVVCVDANLAATRDLYANAETAEVSVTTHNEHAEDFLKKTQERPEFIVLDPPRAGLGAETAA